MVNVFSGYKALPLPVTLLAPRDFVDFVVPQGFPLRGIKELVFFPWWLLILMPTAESIAGHYPATRMTTET
jgi:hypothetical protein